MQQDPLQATAGNLQKFLSISLSFC